MKLENFDKAKRLVEQINKAQKALEDITDKLKEFPGGNSDGGHSPGGKQLYSFHISEWSDGSNGVDLTGTMVGIEVLKFTKNLLEIRLEEFKKELETL